MSREALDKGTPHTLASSVGCSYRGFILGHCMEWITYIISLQTGAW